eukprot:NODE_491_length_7770_cov_0.866771.p2 type:complete len:410 gc:universal NODE_491_length_7770_cov_0.866771:6380-5151(-)
MECLLDIFGAISQSLSHILLRQNRGLKLIQGMARLISTVEPLLFSCPQCKRQGMLRMELLPGDNIKCWSCQHVYDPVGTSQKRSNNENNSLETVKASRDYYEILGVTKDATSDEVRKQYYKRSLKIHPDKTQNLPEGEKLAADEEFKLLSKAYQVLSDAEMKAKYDKYGEKGISEQMMDPGEYFKQQFGGDRFSNIIGEISIGAAFKQMDKELTDEEKKQMQLESDEAMRSRIEKLTHNLLNKLNVYVEDPNNEETFKQLVLIEAQDLKQENYGKELLTAIGYIYDNKASQKSSMALGKIWSNIKDKATVFHDTIGVVRSAIDMQKSHQKFQMVEQGQTAISSEEESRRLQAEMAQKSMETIWKGSRLEVQQVLRQVCDNVLYEPNVDEIVLARRARGLKIIGEIYMDI